MLSVQNVSVSFGGDYLFKDISFRLGPVIRDFEQDLWNN